MPRLSPKAPPPQPIQYSQLTPEDFSDPARVNKLNGMLTQLINAVNAGSGATGRTILPAGIDVQGETISGLGAPKSPSDAVSAAHAESNYGAPALAPQLDIGGDNALKGLTGLWSKVLALQKQIVSAGVRSLNGLTGALNLVPGSGNVTINPSGSDIAISVSATGGGIDELTGDVNAGPGSGTVDATVVGINGASIPASEPYVGTNADGQIVAAATPQSGITQLTGDVTAGPGSGSQAAQVVATHLAAPLPVAQGGSGTATPSLVGGANVTISGAWPNQTVNASGTGMVNPMEDVGDLIVGGAAGSPTRLAAGTSGYVLTSGGPGVAPSYQPGGGGSGSLLMLFPNLFGGTVPTVAGTGLSTAYNQAGTFTATDTVQGIVLTDTTSASNRFEGILKAYPAAPFTLTAVVTVALAMGINNISLMIADSLTGKWMSFGVQPASGGVCAFTFNSPTSFNNTLATASIGNCPLIGLRIADDGTNLTLSASADGFSWQQVYTVAKSASWLGATGFNYLGAMLAPQASPFSSTLLYWNGA